MAYQHQPGIAISVSISDEDQPSEVWSLGLGSADLKSGLEVTPDTVFRLGSISKTITSTAVLVLRDQGKLSLRDPVVKHLPWFQTGERPKNAPEITVWHLLTHTSGLPRELDIPYWTHRRFPTLEGIREALPGTDLVGMPGVHYQYSNLGMALLGAVASAAAEKPYAEVIQDTVLNPLGMRNTYVDTGAIPAGKLATGYLLAEGSPPPLAPDTESAAYAPAANLSSSVNDMARFVLAQFDPREHGALLLRASTLREMHRPHFLFPSWRSARGLGFSGLSKRRTHAGGGTAAGSQVTVRPWHSSPRPESAWWYSPTATKPDPRATCPRRSTFWFQPSKRRAISATKKVRQTGLTNAANSTSGTTATPAAIKTVGASRSRCWCSKTTSRPSTTATRPSRICHRACLSGVNRTQRTPSGESSGRALRFEFGTDGRVDRIKRGTEYLFPTDCETVSEDLHCLR